MTAVVIPTYSFYCDDMSQRPSRITKVQALQLLRNIGSDDSGDDDDLYVENIEIASGESSDESDSQSIEEENIAESQRTMIHDAVEGEMISIVTSFHLLCTKLCMNSKLFQIEKICTSCKTCIISFDF